MIRLDKYLADMGIGTRSEVKHYIRKGKVAVDGITVKKPELKVDSKRQEVIVDGKPVVYREFEYYMLHKPAGVVSATKDIKERTVLDLIDESKRRDLFPVGRLDKDTEGLLILTNDGALAHRLLSPAKHVDKTYYAKIRGEVTETDIRQFKEGLDIGDERPTLPAELTIISSGEVSEISLTIQEGRFHQVKRMFRAVGKEVVYLKRISMGGITLDEELACGEWRELRKEELEQLCWNR